MPPLKNPEDEANRRKLYLRAAARLDGWFTEFDVIRAVNETTGRSQSLSGPVGKAYLRDWHTEGLLERTQLWQLRDMGVAPEHHRWTHGQKMFYRWRDAVE
jgi:hypothetical protein